jgi:hypothetical protein
MNDRSANMSRRKFLGISACFGIAGVLSGFSLWKTLPTRKTLMLLTADPQKDLIRLKKVLQQYNLLPCRVTQRAVQASAQDITILIDGQVQDPTAGNMSGPLYEFAVELKSRQHAATTLITWEEASFPGKEVIFEQNGTIVESVPISKNYHCIDIPGELGHTRFRIENGAISVVDSSCRYGLCEKMGKIQRGKIVCAPNKIIASMPEPISRYDALSG